MGPNAVFYIRKCGKMGGWRMKFREIRIYSGFSYKKAFFFFVFFFFFFSLFIYENVEKKWHIHKDGPGIERGKSAARDNFHLST
jgi:hypothetical protein